MMIGFNWIQTTAKQACENIIVLSIVYSKKKCIKLKEIKIKGKKYSHNVYCFTAVRMTAMAVD